jgi:hypothetical protein
MRAHTHLIGFLALCGSTALVVGGCGGIVDKPANARLREKIGNTSVTVFPAFVREGRQAKYDADAAGAIGDLLTEESLAAVTVSDAEVPITSKWGMNQAKMFRGSAADFSTYVRDNPVETEYALLPEYLIGGRGTPVGVHLYLVDAEGVVAYAFLNNSHHKVFTDVNPKTPDDCTAIVLSNLRGDLASDAESESDARPVRTDEEDPVQAKRLAAMQARGADASLTIFPVVIWATNKAEKGVEDIGKEVGKVLGLLLEKAGMGNLEITDSVFVLPADVEFDAAAERFGDFVRANPIKTEYALYAEVVGRTGSPPQFDEIRGVIVDRAGDCVWVDRQTPDDSDFKRIKPECLMTCCVLLTERVRTQLRIPESASNDSGEGRFARMFAENSPAPDKAEWTVIEQRQAAMKKPAPSTKVAVFPVRLSDDEVSRESATHLANLLSEEELCEATALDTPLHIEIQPSRNQQKLLWDLARAFQGHVRQNPPEADYVLYADYMISPRHQKVGAVHFVICDRDGEWVIVDFQNSHHSDFQSIDPKTRADCDRLVAKRLEGYLR